MSETTKIITVGAVAVIATVALAAWFWGSISRSSQYFGSSITQQYGISTSSTAIGTGSALATLIGASGRTIYVSDLSGSSDVAGSAIIVKDGSNIIWETVVGTTTGYSIDFASPLRATAGNNVSVSINGAGTSTVNISGYYAP